MLLSVDTVSVTLGEALVLESASLSVRGGEILGLVGPNGAGKSTLFSVISGFIRPASGRILLGENDISAWTVVRRARIGLARTFQIPREFRTLSVRENLAVALANAPGESIWQPLFRPHHVAQRELEISGAVERVIRLCELQAVADLPAASLSGGQKKLLEIGRAAMSDPKLLMLDEPFNGVNPVMIERLSDVIRTLNRTGTTVLIIEHNMQALSKLVTRLYVMDRGKILAEGSPAGILRSVEVREAYLGKHGAAHA